ncbi:MAG: SLBB domain-containing protein, partial [Treponema sp.]|nr:SLBB domain-containing protein [Treponema sp.]
AVSSPEYLVTPGDRYVLAYSLNGVPVTYPISVDNSYRVRVANLGVINVSGKTFPQFKAEAEAVVTKNYPLGAAQLVLEQAAAFTVFVSGEVSLSRDLPAWALERLGDILDAAELTPYASLRDVTVASAGGKTGTFDIFKARRSGDVRENPYLRPGDRITVKRTERMVTISGAVEREGSYQLLAGEHLKELVRYYGSGHAPLADLSRIELVRYVDGEDESGNKVFLGAKDIEGNYPLKDFDSVYIPWTTDLAPVMFAEGAVNAAVSPGGGEELTTSNRVIVRFEAGENYASLVQKNQGWFSAISDTQNAYVRRGGERIMINLNPMLYDSSYRSEYQVEANDVLVIPFRQYFVTVAGAVAKPGRYAYIPDRDWEYYIGLAGGFDPVRNMMQVVTIRDMGGKRMGKKDIIGPETIITASNNGWLYNFNLVAPVVTTALSIVTTFITVLMLQGR